MVGTPIHTPDGVAQGAVAAPASPRRPAPHVPRCRQWRVRLLAVLAVLGPGLVSRLRRQRRRRDHDLLARRRQLRLRPAVGHPRQPDRPVLHPGGGRAPRARHRQGPDGPHPGALGRALDRVRRRCSCWPRTSARPWRSSPASASALGIFGVPPQISAAVAAVVVVAFIALGSYSRVQYLFVGIGIARLGRLRDLGLPGRAGLGAGLPVSMVDPAAVRRRRCTGWRSSARSARRSRRGARPSSSRTSSTRACGRTTCAAAGSTSSRARC